MPDLSAELKEKHIFRDQVKRQGIWIIFGLIFMVIPVLFEGCFRHHQYIMQLHN